MPIDPRTLLRDARGVPQPPLWLTERLQRDNPGIGVFYTKASWAVTESWKHDDMRRKRIREEGLDPNFAFDVVGYLPTTCSLDEAPGFINGMLRGLPKSRFTETRNAVNNWNNTEWAGQDAESYDELRDAIENDMGSYVSSAGVFSAGEMNNAKNNAKFDPFESEQAAPSSPAIDLANMPNSADPELGARIKADRQARMQHARDALAAKRAASTAITPEGVAV